jgi:hypothetical protein
LPTRLLRAHVAAQARGGMDAEPSRGGGGGAGAAPVDAARAELRGAWELACVLNFLHVFRPQLTLGEEAVRAEALEDALLTAGCTPPLLHELHKALLQEMYPRTSISSWRVLLADKVARAWHELGEGPCPFEAHPTEAEEAYDRLSPVARVRVLRALCELRLDARSGDLRACIDDAQEAPRGEGADYHGGGAALGQDVRARRYFYQGLDSGPRLYRERSRVGAAVPRTLVRWRRARGREGAQRCEEAYTQPGPVLLEAWDLVATTGCGSRGTCTASHATRLGACACAAARARG